MSAMKKVFLVGLLFVTSITVAQTSNLELKKIVEEDQGVRTTGTQIDWKTVSRSDADRRLLVRKMIDAGQLHTAEDYRGAALVFQHGSQSDDYLLAHSLAVIAASKGDKIGLRLAAATLDRYLQSQKQPQIYGTQYFTIENTPATQEPYNKSLVTDEIRKQLRVPTVKEQESQRKEFDAKRTTSATNSAK